MFKFSRKFFEVADIVVGKIRRTFHIYIGLHPVYDDYGHVVYTEEEYYDRTTQYDDNSFEGFSTLYHEFYPWLGLHVVCDTDGKVYTTYTYEQWNAYKQERLNMWANILFVQSNNL